MGQQSLLSTASISGDYTVFYLKNIWKRIENKSLIRQISCSDDRVQLHSLTFFHIQMPSTPSSSLCYLCPPLIDFHDLHYSHSMAATGNPIQCQLRWKSNTYPLLCPFQSPPPSYSLLFSICSHSKHPYTSLNLWQLESTSIPASICTNGQCLCTTLNAWSVPEEPPIHQTEMSVHTMLLFHLLLLQWLPHFLLILLLIFLGSLLFVSIDTDSLITAGKLLEE